MNKTLLELLQFGQVSLTFIVIYAIFIKNKAHKLLPCDNPRLNKKNLMPE